MHSNFKKIIFAALFSALVQAGAAHSQPPDVPSLPPPVGEEGALPKELGGALPKDLGGELPPPPDQPPPPPEEKPPEKKEEPKPVEKPADKPDEAKKDALKQVEKQVEKESDLKKVEPPKTGEVPSALMGDPLMLDLNSPDALRKRRSEREMGELQKLMEEQLEMIKKTNPDVAKAMEEAQKQQGAKEEPKKVETPPPPPPPPTPPPPPPEPVRTPAPAATPAQARGKDNPIIFSANSILRISPKPDPEKPELDDLELNFKVTVERSGREVFPKDIIIKDYFADDDSGALFVYPVAQQAVLNVSKLYVPRDILFINDAGEIVEIVRKVPPRNVAPITSKDRVTYVLQLNPGVVRKYAIRVGDKAMLISQEDIFR